MYERRRNRVGTKGWRRRGEEAGAYEFMRCAYRFGPVREGPTQDCVSEEDDDHSASSQILMVQMLPYPGPVR